jgi:ArsR family transcriptional regulator
VEQANLSQHLSVLRSRQLLTNRKVGNQVFYAVRDPLLLQLLDLLREYCSSHLTDTLALLDEMQQEGAQ